jgi:hypothetical protein
MKKHFGQALRVRYQVDWPDASDVMNKFARADVQSRVTYYKITSSPATVVDGVETTPSHAKIYTKQGYTAPVKIDVKANPIADDNILSGEVVVTANQAKSGSFMLHIAVIERAIIYTKAPGSNGDKSFYDILRKLTTGTGQNIGSLSAGTGTPYPFSWTVDVTKVKKEQLAVVAWIQDASNKAILNAGTSIPNCFIEAQIPEQSTGVKNSSTHYIRCLIKNDNPAALSAKISVRDSTRSSFTNTKLGWIPFDASSPDPLLTDSIVTTVKSGDSLVFWTVTTAPAATGSKAVFELFAENRSDGPQALGWGSVRYFNLNTSANGAEFPKPAITAVLPVASSVHGTLPAFTVRENTLLYSVPAGNRADISLFTLDGALVCPLFSGFLPQGTGSLDLGPMRLNRGVYVVRCSLGGVTINRIYPRTR